MSSLQADPQHNTKREGSLRGRCQKRETAPSTALLPPALLTELSTGFSHGDVSTDPPFTSAWPVGEGMQKWYDPVTHPMETPRQTVRSTQVCSSQRLHPQSPTSTASSLLPPQNWQAALSGRPRAVSATHHPPDFKWTFLQLCGNDPQAASALLYQHTPPSHVPLHLMSGNFTSRGENHKEKQRNTLPNKHIQVRTQHFIIRLLST